MNDSTLKMVLSGILFGLWPLFMNKSNLNGGTSVTFFAVIVLLTVLPFGIYNGINISGTRWWFAVLAGCTGALGLIAFNSVLSKVSKGEVGQLFILMVVVQVSIPAIYHVYTNGGLTLKTASGFVAAIIAAILLV
ncbi:MAG: hypothetical protein K9L31_00125 [Candidatus Pacebacteria bacterium]|nr:hypothetical protein [Candidatus Paceibacterota bacterium]